MKKYIRNLVTICKREAGATGVDFLGLKYTGSGHLELSFGFHGAERSVSASGTPKNQDHTTKHVRKDVRRAINQLQEI